MFKYPLLAAFLALVACAAEKEAPTADTLPKVQLALNWFSRSRTRRLVRGRRPRLLRGKRR